MERFARKPNSHFAVVGFTSTLNQFYLRCATRIGLGFCQQQFLKLGGRPADPRSKCKIVKGVKTVLKCESVRIKKNHFLCCL